jgi:NAD(P)H-hydrate epimerase
MIPLLTAEAMRAADRRAIDRLGVAGLVLMENAGREAVDLMERAFGPLRGRRVVVLCGRGNNGGDGFVAARHLEARGVRVDAWLAGAGGELRGEAAANLAILRQGGVPVREVVETAGGVDLGPLRAALGTADLVIDALLGTGTRGAATGLVAAVIATVNESGRPVCALDLPSGLSADTGTAEGPAIRARLTVTFGLPKLGLFLGAGAVLAGRVEIADLGVPRDWLATESSVALLEAGDVRAALPPRPLEAHKGRYGHVLVVAGALGKTGAAVLTCRGALRSGAGLVTCALPASQQPVVAGHLPEAMTEALPETVAHTPSAKAVDRILELAAARQSLVVGPGAGLDPETQALMREIARETACPTVIDADGLTALVGQVGLLREARGPRILTPHPGEAARLLGTSAGAVQADRLGSARRLAEASGAVVALKGAGTVVARPDGIATLNPTGNPGMATGGMGDVLSGIVGGLLAQGVEVAAATRAAVYLHGLAGDLLAAQTGGAGLLAGEVADLVPAAIRRVLGRADG